MQSKLGPQGCAASALPTEPSPSPFPGVFRRDSPLQRRASCEIFQFLVLWWDWRRGWVTQNHGEWVARFATAALLTTKELIRFVDAQLVLTVSAVQPCPPGWFSPPVSVSRLLAQVVSFMFFLGD